MPKILIVGDLHLRAKKLGDVASAWKKVIDWVHERGDVTLVVQAGDVFDHYNVYGREASTGTVYEALLAPFSGRNLRMFAAVGNHDMGGPGDVDALAPVDKYPWITVARQPGVYRLDDGRPDDGFSICAMPWLNRANLLSRLVQKGMDPKEAYGKVGDAISSLISRLKSQVTDHKKKGRFVLFVGHLEVTGAKLTGGMAQANGAFEFAPAALADVGCDAYALAHIHIRQHVPGLPNQNDGYLGTLCQLNFGEQGNKVGCRLIDVDGGVLKADKWIDNESSPKYFTVESLEGSAHRPGIDYVKLRGESRPEIIPDGVIFERVPSAAASKRRTEQQLSADASMDVLLETWSKLDGCAVPTGDLAAAAAKLAAAGTLPADAIGSLDKVTRVALKNITCHTDTDVDLSGVNGLCGIEGPTGSGKTTLIEAVMLGLYGSTPSRPSLNSWISTGHKGDALIEVDFVSSGKPYRVRRELRRTEKNFSHKAYLFELDKNDAVAGPNVENVLSKVCGLVGDPSMVWAGAFSSQDEAGSLLDVEPAERKKLFAKLLGTEKFLFLSELAKKACQADSAIVEASKNHASRVKQELAEEPAIRAAIDGLKARLNDSAAIAAGMDEELDAAKAVLASFDAVRLEIARASSQLEALQRKKDDVLARGRALKAKKAGLEGSDTAAAKAALDAARSEKERADKAARQALFKNNEYNALAAERESGRRAIDDNVRDIEIEAGRAEAELASVARRQALLGDFPNQPICGACPLARDGIEARGQHPELARRSADLKSKLEMGRVSLSEYAAETAKLLASKRAEARPPPEDDARLASRVAAAEAAFENASGAKQQVAVIESQISSLREAYHDVEGQIAAVAIPKEPDDAGPRARAASIQDKLSGVRSQAGADSRELGRQESRLESLMSKKAEADALMADVALREKSVDVNAALAKAFGRDGIPQLVVDGAIPRFEEIMAGLLREFDGKWSIQINSQNTTKKGSVKEVIDIVVDDGHGERELFTYSGGEKRVLKGVVRLAFSALQAERSGKGLRVLVLDEATDKMDGDVSQTFIRMLSKASNSFRQVFIVSHADHVLSTLPNRILLSRAGSSAKVINA
jgi:DNA repair exonuclease SbcCD ATPase subunit/DNA repair exonuclease SbcCD nuclease subunit